MRILITGTGRSGTGYMAALLLVPHVIAQRLKHRASGTSDWHAGARRTWPNAARASRPHVVRHPLDVFATMAGIKGSSWNYIAEFQPEIHGEPDRLVRCMRHWVQWNQWAREISSATLQVEEINHAYYLMLACPFLLQDFYTVRSTLQKISTRTNTRRPRRNAADGGAAPKAPAGESQLPGPHIVNEGH